MPPVRRPSTGRLRGLRQLLLLLREHGVVDYENGPVKVKLGPAPARPVAKVETPPPGDVAFARQALRSVGMSEEQAADLAASLGGGE